MPWYVYAAVTPLFYSISNYIDKFLLEKKIKNPFSMTVLSGMVSGLIGVIVWGVAGFKLIGIIPTALMFLAGLLLIFYLLPYFAAMKQEDASTIVPMFQFIPVFTLLLSSLFLREELSLKQIAGLVVVVMSGVLISIRQVKGNLFRPRRALLYMFAASFLYGSVGILFRYVVKNADFWTVFSYEYMATGIGCLLIFLFSARVRDELRQERRELRLSFGIISINNLICIIAQVSELYAISLVAVPLVNIVGSIQPLLSFIEGIGLTILLPHIIREDISRVTLLRKSAAILIMFGGLFLVYG